MGDLKTIDLKGNDYVLVAERVKGFRNNFKNHKLITELVSLNEGMCIFKAEVLNEKNEVVSTGYAYEKENAGFVNKTSFIENCETSAVGRALGFYGIGIDKDIASAEELVIAQAKQTDEKIENQNNYLNSNLKLTKGQRERITREIKDNPEFAEELNNLRKAHNVKTIKDLNKDIVEEFLKERGI